MGKLNRKQIAWRVAQDIPEGAYVNLGIGAPEMVANFVPETREVVIHSENGLLGMGPTPAPGEENPDLINAGKKPVTLVTGGSISHHTDSFAMIRGGHIDMAILGAMEVSENGDLANWMIPGKLVKGMGGAMDLVSGVKRVIVIMDHTNKKGDSKLLKKCTLPLTGRGVVDSLITNYGMFEIISEGIKIIENLLSK